LIETGTWTSDGGTTTGTITCDATAGSPTVTEVVGSCFASNGDTAVKPANDAGPNKVKITFTANDDGDYSIFGRVA
jgi:hypothetical protein